MSGELHLIARVGQTWIALPAERVEAVVRMPEVVPIPTAPAAIPGLVAIRSRLLTLVDPAATVYESDEPAPLAIITSIDGHGYAIAVQAVDDVTAISTPGTYPGDLAEGWAALDPAMANVDGRIILMIDLDRLIGLAGDQCRLAA
jgi:purine-binding chemotaxis protein CheW